MIPSVTAQPQRNNQIFMSFGVDKRLIGPVQAFKITADEVLAVFKVFVFCLSIFDSICLVRIE